MIVAAGYIAPVPDAKNGFPEKCSKSGYLEQKIGKTRSIFLKSVVKILILNTFQEQDLFLHTTAHGIIV